MRLPEHLQLDTITRVGNPSEGSRRPILVKFKKLPSQRSSKSIEIQTQGHLLQPREYHERRNLLLPQYKRAEENNQRTRFVRDKLFVNGKQVTPYTIRPLKKANTGRMGMLSNSALGM